MQNTSAKIVALIFLMGLLVQLPALAADLALANITQAQLAGEISTRDALIQSFYLMVDNTKLDSKFRVNSSNDSPIKCGTQIMLEIGRNWESLPADFKASYRHYFLAGYQTADANTYNSPGATLQLIGVTG